MNTEQRSFRRISADERRKLVALGVQAGKSNRAIAKELGCDEGTVRRDRKFLATPVVSVQSGNHTYGPRSRKQSYLPAIKKRP